MKYPRTIEIYEHPEGENHDYADVLLGAVEAASLREALKLFLAKHDDEFHVPMLAGNVASCLDDEGSSRLLVARDKKEAFA